MSIQRAVTGWPAARGSVVRWLVALLAAAAGTVAPAAAQADGTVKLNAPKAQVKPTSLVTFNGTAGKARSGRVSVQRRVGKSWKTIAKGRTGAKGRFALTWITPSSATRVTVRAVLAGGSRRPSKLRRLRVLAPAKGARKVIVSPKTRIISPSAVESIPAPGKLGKVTYAGGNDVAAGQIIVVGKGEDTPSGFLGRVTAVDRKNGETVLSTVPATLLQAVPEGSVKLSASKVSTAKTRATPRATQVTCTGSVGASITHEVTFTAGLAFDSNWTLLGGLQSASVTASAGMSATIRAAIEAAGSCTLGQIQLLKIKGPSVSGFVGPVPIVMTSDLTVFLDAAASAQAGVSTTATAGFDASAGAGWTKANGFYSTSSFVPRFSFEPPTLSASATVGAYVTPTVDVLLYGLAGPQIALRTGLELNADSAGDPWWSLSVPVDLTAAISIPVLNLTSPLLHLYTRSFPIVDAGGPYGSTPEPPPAANNVSTLQGSLTAGFAHACGLRPGGTVACWGSDSSGQLGNGAGGSGNVPSAVSGLADAAGLSAGYDHTCAVRVHGEIDCWGSDGDGRLGNGAGGSSQTPTAVSNMTTATAVAAGSQHTCALQTNRHVSCWGANGDHQLGDGGTSPSQVPVDMGINNATSVASGYDHSCAIRSDHTIACWGNNNYGQLGNGSTAPSTEEVAVSGIANATMVTTGLVHSCALLETAHVMCWGHDSSGQLGDGGGDSSSSVPVEVSGITDATAVDVGFEHSCATLASGGVKCWGSGKYGELGNGGSGEGYKNFAPVAVSGLADATAVTAGNQHGCALRADGGHMVCWGGGQFGEMGNGASNVTNATPVTVSNFP